MVRFASRENGRNGREIGKRWFMTGYMLILLLITLLSQKAQAASFNAVKAASQHVLSGGTWEKDDEAVRYRKKPTASHPQGEYAANIWAMIGGNIYYFDKYGNVVFGRFKYNGRDYMADEETGEVYHEDIFEVRGKMYGARADGVLARGQWCTIDGEKRYFNGSGRMMINRWVGNYYVGPDGTRVSKVRKNKIIQKVTKKEKTDKSLLIIVGASRVYYMKKAVRSAARFTWKKKRWNTVFITQKGMGYDWLIGTGGPRLQAYLDLYPKSKVVFQMGNNDLLYSENGYTRDYIEYYKKIIAKYPRASFYIMDVLPGQNERANEGRREFNRTMKEAFPEQWIGGYDYLMSLPFKTVADGVHYKPSTSKAIFEYIRRKVGLR